MNRLLENSLFQTDKKRFSEIKKVTESFRKEYVGNTIVRDDIFRLIEKYAARNQFELKLLKLPFHDSEVCAFTCVRSGVVFITINTAIPLNKQIFAAAHELYHVYCYINNKSEGITFKGSILNTSTVDSNAVSNEEREANAFASILLAPKEQIEEQSKLQDKNASHSNVINLLSYMDIFAMPYKAMVIKLFECSVFTTELADIFLSPEMDNLLKKYAVLYDNGVHWLNPTNERNIASIESLIEANKQDGVLSTQRSEEDLKAIKEIKDWFS